MLTKHDLKYLRRAHSLAATSTYGTKNIKIGAVVVDKQGNTYSGKNTKKSDPIQQKYNHKRFGQDVHDSIGHSMHAEMAAIKNAIIKRANLQGATIYVSRVGGSHSEYGMCRPCPACIGAVKAVGIEHIIYTTEQGVCHEYVF